MVKELQEGLSDKDINKIIGILEKKGKSKWLKRWQSHMALPNNINILNKNIDEVEKILRYLLLRVLINQQARFEKVREMSIRISEEFTDALLLRPYEISESKIFKIFKDVAGDKGSLLYRVGALGGIKPISLFTYRFKTYEGFIRWLNENNLYFFNIIKEKLNEKSYNLFDFLCTHTILNAGWVGNDPKACRMFVNWIVFLFNEVWELEIGDIKDTLMIVDGHVGKVFCRSGLLNQVIYEKSRPYIIQASKMRKSIEDIVYNSKRIPFYVDNGAFYLFEDEYCLDINPNCDSCPINKHCKKYIKWTAYKIFEK